MNFKPPELKLGLSKRRTRRGAKARRGVKRGDMRGTKTLKMFFSKNFRLLGVFLVICVFLYISLNFAQLVTAYRSIDISPVSIDGKAFEEIPNVDNEQLRTLILFEEHLDGEEYIEHAVYFLYEPRSASQISVYIPGWVYVPRLGEDPVTLRNLKYAGGLDGSEQSPEEYTVQVLSDALGLQVDTYVWFEEEATRVLYEDIAKGIDESKGGDEFINRFLSSVEVSALIFDSQELIEMSNGIYSNRSIFELRERVRVYNRDLVSESNVLLDFSSEEMLDEEVTGAQADRYYMDLASSDALLQSKIRFFAPREIEREQAKIEIYNASGVPGLASGYSRLLANNALNVIRAGNAPIEYKESRVYVSDLEDYEQSLELVQTLIPQDFEVIEGRTEFLTTGDLVIVVGQDIVSE